MLSKCCGSGRPVGAPVRRWRASRASSPPRDRPAASSPEPSAPSGRREPLLRPLLAAGAADAPPTSSSSGWGCGSARAGSAARPHVMLNMVSTVDGRATLGGRSGPISGPADRALFHALRAAVGRRAGGRRHGARRALRSRSSATPPTRRLRLERGLPEEPLACIVSGALSLERRSCRCSPSPTRSVVILTASQASLAAPRRPGRLRALRARRASWTCAAH